MVTPRSGCGAALVVDSEEVVGVLMADEKGAEPSSDALSRQAGIAAG
jgi:hypothetical protein